jgi:hypothetical protein
MPSRQLDTNHGGIMLITVQGLYENGAIKLDEIPAGIRKAKVIITLIPESDLDEEWESMKLSSQSFSEWDNEMDSIYDSL